MTYRIEKGVKPIPHRLKKYPFKEMVEGDSFQFAYKDLTPVANAAYQAGIYYRVLFSVRRDVEEGHGRVFHMGTKIRRDKFEDE